MKYISNVKQSGVHEIFLISHQIEDWTDEPGGGLEPAVELLLVVKGKKVFSFQFAGENALWTHAVYALIQKERRGHLQRRGDVPIYYTHF